MSAKREALFADDESPFFGEDGNVNDEDDEQDDEDEDQEIKNHYNEILEGIKEEAMNDEDVTEVLC